MPRFIKDQLGSKIVKELPVIVNFAIERNPVIKRSDLVYVNSKFYETSKMRCYEFYKPII